jgi:hypothetical protein
MRKWMIQTAAAMASATAITLSGCVYICGYSLWGRWFIAGMFVILTILILLLIREKL